MENQNIIYQKVGILKKILEDYTEVCLKYPNQKFIITGSIALHILGLKKLEVKEELPDLDLIAILNFEYIEEIDKLVESDQAAVNLLFIGSWDSRHSISNFKQKSGLLIDIFDTNYDSDNFYLELKQEPRIFK